MDSGRSRSRLVVAGVSSGVGKTMIASAIMYLLRKKGLRVQSFKVGPDFIDPAYHSLVTGRQSYNLDIWMMGTKGVTNCFRKASLDADVAVVEGVMGLFDGIYGKNDFGSTAHVAKILNASILLVIDAAKASGSIAALAYGFLNFDKRTKVSGIILNNVASMKHLKAITEAFSNKIRVPIVGIVYRNNSILLKERHLGLIPVAELQNKKKKAILRSARYISNKIQISRIKDLPKRTFNYPFLRDPLPRPEIKIALALDESFNFYYAENLDALQKKKAKVIHFSPVNDKNLPEGISGIILGGGFPEVLAEKLEKNYSMKKAISKAVKDGMPLYAECGGLMYLTKNIVTRKNNKNVKRKMIGLIDADTFMNCKLTLNYTEVRNSGSFFGNIRKIRGHEFHYSTIKNIAKDFKFAYDVVRGNGIHNKKDGIIVYNCLASYMHIHFGADNRLPEKLVQNCVNYSKR